MYLHIIVVETNVLQVLQNHKDSTMENRFEYPLYSVVHSEVIHSPQAFRQPPKDEKEMKEKEEKKTRTRIPISKFKQTVEKVKEERRNNRDDKQQSRQSAIPRLKEKSLIHAHDTKKSNEDFNNTNHANNATIINAVESDTKNIKDNNEIENGNKNVLPIESYKENRGTELSDKGLKHTGIPLLVRSKSNIQKFGNNENKSNQKGDSNINKLEKDFIASDKNYTGNEVSIANNDDVGKSNLNCKKADDSNEDEVPNIEEENIEINAEELQAIQDFDKIYEDIIDNEEADSIIDEIVEEIKVDPEKLKTKFEEIVHINVGKIKSKIPLLKQTSLHDLPVSKILERRLSLKNYMQMNDDRHINSNTYKTDSGKDCIKIENNKTTKKDDMPYTPHVEQRTNTIKEVAKEAVSVIDEIKTVNNIETVQYDNNIIISTEEIKLAKVDEKPDEEPVFDGIKTVNKIDVLKCNNNIIVAEEMKQNKTDSKAIKEISQEGPVFDDIKTANNIEIVENNNNMIVTEEVKLINMDKPFNKSADKNNDIIFSKVPGSTKMVQNLLSQMGNKNEDVIELPTSNQEIDDISTKDNAKVLIKKENDLESKRESKINKLINKIKTRDQGIKKHSHELSEDILVNASIKSKIAAFNEDKTVMEVKPTKNISPNQDSELKTKEIVRIPVKDVEGPLPADNGNNLEINLQEITNNNHFTDEHNANNVNYQKPSNLDKNIEQTDYNEPIDANVLNYDLKDAQKEFDQANIIEEPSYTLDENENQPAENSDVQNHIEDYIPKGKVRSIINKIGSNETRKETPKAEVEIELPKKKSVLSRIALFERQSSKEPAKPKPLIEAKSKEVAKSVNYAPKIVNEIEKVHILEDLNDKYQEFSNKELSIDMKPVIMDTEIKENHKKEQNVEFDTNKPKIYCANKIIAKFEKKVEHRNAKLNNDINFVPLKKQTKKLLQKVDDKHPKDFVSVKEDDLIIKEEIPNLMNKELNIEDRRISLLSSPELELGDTKRGKVHEMIVRMNSKENLYQDVEKKEVISIKERPQKRTVSEKIALFEVSGNREDANMIFMKDL